MKFLFVNTPNYDMYGFLGAPTSMYYACALLTSESTPTNISLKDQAEIKFLDPISLNEYYDKLSEFILDKDLKMVAFSSTSHSHWIALKGARLCKEKNPDIIIIMGGPHEDEIQKRGINIEKTIFRWKDRVDIVVNGDGEYILEWICKKILMFNKINRNEQIINNLVACSHEIRDLPGIGSVDIRHDQGFIQIPFSNQQLVLDHIPFINRSYVDPRHSSDYSIFKDKSGNIKITAQMMTHRGCRGGCRYCSEGQYYCKRSISNIIDEIQLLKREYYVEAIFFDDSTFTEDSSETIGLCSKLQNCDIEWGCLTRFDKVNEEILRIMKNSGCSYIYFGLEQFDDSILCKIGKNINVRRIIKTMDICNKLEIKTGVSCLFGIGESPEIAKKTVTQVSDWVKNGNLEIVSISANCIHIGSNSVIRENKNNLIKYDFDQEPPNFCFPWFAFEEGIWHHPREFSEEYAWFILDNVITKIPSKSLVRKDLLFDAGFI